jgi:hypothetical protein
MSITAGTLSIVSVSSTFDSLVTTVATAGTGPYTYQWYRSTTTGFTPGGGNIISGATALTLNDTGLTPLTQYFYKVVYTDTGASNATATSSQLAVTTTATTLNPNAFTQTQNVGTLDLRFDYDTVSAQIDVSQTTPLYAGAAVKLVPYTSPNTAPKLVGCTANTDEVWGFINFDIKTVAYGAGSLCEVSQAGNVMYLYSTGAITQGSQVTLDLTTMGGVASATGSNNIVGWAYDGAAAAGILIRVKLQTPSFLFA